MKIMKNPNQGFELDWELMLVKGDIYVVSFLLHKHNFSRVLCSEKTRCVTFIKGIPKFFSGQTVFQTQCMVDVSIHKTGY